MKLDLNSVYDAAELAKKYEDYTNDAELHDIKDAMRRNCCDSRLHLSDYGVLFVAMLNFFPNKDGLMHDALECLRRFEREE